MLKQVLDFFDVVPDYELDVMKDNQTLFGVTERILSGMEKVLDDCKPELIFIQGDTTTAFVSALAGFYKKIKIAHIEAGLRSFDKYSPFPEETNRGLAGHIADFHFAPTVKAKENLIAENIKNHIYVVGNTVIDALFFSLKIIKNEESTEFSKKFDFIDFSKKIILVTAHRRESFGKPFEEICKAIRKVAEDFDDVEIVYPVHLNPNVRKPVFELLGKIKNIHLINPLIYPDLIWLMEKSYLVVTDSGGIQEEAPSIGKPVLVIRDVTERTEGIDAGTAKLIGSNSSNVAKNISLLLTDKSAYKKMSEAINPYGDGKSSERIVKIIGRFSTLQSL